MDSRECLHLRWHIAIIIEVKEIFLSACVLHYTYKSIIDGWYLRLIIMSIINHLRNVQMLTISRCPCKSLACELLNLSISLCYTPCVAHIYEQF